jgi:hypothetical protein
MVLKALAVAWFRKEDWARWRAIDPDFEPDYDHWLGKAEAVMKERESSEYVLEKVIIDPDEFTDWCRVNRQNVDSGARAVYAAFMLSRKHRTDH